MKKNLILSILLVLGMVACSPSVERKTGQVLENAGDMVKGTKNAVDRNWQTASPDERARGQFDNGVEQDPEWRKRERDRY